MDEHLKRSNREIALPIEACVMMLLETGMKEEVRRIVILKNNMKTAHSFAFACNLENSSEFECDNWGKYPK